MSVKKVEGRGGKRVCTSEGPGKGGRGGEVLPHERFTRKRRARGGPARGKGSYPSPKTKYDAAVNNSKEASAQ